MDAEELTNLSMLLYQEIPSRKDRAENKIVATIRFYEENPNMGAVLMIENPETVIGYAIVFRFWSDEYGGLMLGMDELFIRREFRGRFVASQFIHSLMDAEKQDPCFAGMELEAHPGNAVAAGFFENAGFERNHNQLYLYLVKRRS